jgi:subtilase family serine protease
MKEVPMKKKKKIVIIISAVIIVLTSLILFASTAMAAVNIDSRSVTDMFDYNGGSGWKSLDTPEHYVVGSSPEQVAYCLQHRNGSPNNSSYNTTDILDSYSSSVRTGLRIILENGYPYATGGLTAVKARYATANAIRFWLSENGDSGQYNFTNLGTYSDAQLRTAAANGQIGSKIRSNSGYTDVLQFAIELLIKARAQTLMTHNITLSTPAMSISGSYFVGTATVSLTNMNGGYALDTSDLPSGSIVSGCTGQSGDTLTIRIPLNETNANQTFSISATGKDNRTRSNMFAYAPGSSSLQRVIVAKNAIYNEAKTVSIAVGTPQIYADLTITSLNSNAASYEAGDTITITAAIANQGLRSAGGFYATLTSPDLATQSKYVSSLASGGTTSVTFTYTAGQYTADKTINITATADSTGAVSESNEGNNTRSASFKVLKYIPPLPDLTVTSLTSSKAEYEADETITITTTIKNQGDNAAGGFYVALSSADYTTQTKYISSLAVGGTTSVTFTYTAGQYAADKTISVTATADSTGAVSESNEGNNTRSASFKVLKYIPPLPDLTVTSLTSSKAEYEADETITITATIKNQGDGAAGGFYVALSSADFTTQTKYISSLAVGGTTSATFTYTAGRYTSDKTISITATADSSGVVSESNESNNTRAASFKVLKYVPPLSDLTVATLAGDKPLYEAGEAITVTGTIKNIGESASPATTARLTVQGIGTFTANISALNTGASQTATFSFTAPTSLSPQAISMTAFVDPNNLIVESNEDNNTRSATISINALRPDIEIVDSTITDWYAGKDVTVSATIRNRTAQPVPSVAIRLTIGGVSYTENIPIAGNGSNLAVFRFKVPAAGSYSVRITADPDGVLNETDEGNNALTKNIQALAVPACIVADPDNSAMEQRYKVYGLMSVPTTASSAYHTWQEVRLENGNYVIKNFYARLTTTFSISPDSRIAYADKPRQMESGFGFSTLCTTTLTTNYDHAEKIVGAQMVWLRYPESAYGQLSGWQDVRDGLEVKTGKAGDVTVTWRLAVNPWSTTGSRLHYTPLWFPDGSYTAWAQAFYAWSPVGQLYEYKPDALTVEGDMYDRITTIKR